MLLFVWLMVMMIAFDFTLSGGAKEARPRSFDYKAHAASVKWGQEQLNWERTVPQCPLCVSVGPVWS